MAYPLQCLAPIRWWHMIPLSFPINKHWKSFTTFCCINYVPCTMLSKPSYMDRENDSQTQIHMESCSPFDRPAACLLPLLDIQKDSERSGAINSAVTSHLSHCMQEEMVQTMPSIFCTSESNLRIHLQPLRPGNESRRRMKRSKLSESIWTKASSSWLGATTNEIERKCNCKKHQLNDG